jgi:hypothetical protein
MHARLAEIETREEELIAREAELNRRDSELHRVESEGARGRDLDEWTARLEAREKELADRESSVGEDADLAETARERVDKREKRIAQTEANLRERTRELDDREEQIDRREARDETDYEIRLEKLENRESALAELEEKLGSKETQLAAYVAQAQGALQRRESEWWDKQLGNNDDADAEVA